MQRRIFYSIILLIFVITTIVCYTPVRTNNRMIPDGKTKKQLLLVKKFKNGKRLFDFILASTDKLERGDVLVFYDPTITDLEMKQRNKLASRIIGTPGKQISIDNKNISIDGKLITEWYPLYFLYRISIDKNMNTEQLNSIIKTEGIYQWQELIKNKAYNFFATTEVAKSFSELEGVVNIRREQLLPGENAMQFFPKNQYFQWNSDYSGPFIVPQKDVTIFLNYKNIALYQRIIEVYESHKLISNSNSIIIDGEEVEKYTFEQDYFFVMSDKRDKGYDSRNFGFVPASHIIGKAIKK